MITLKIDLTKIDKTKLFKSEKTGNIYLDAVLIETPKSEHNDYMIVQNQTKEEREAKKESIILGNGKKFEAKSVPVEEDDLPF